MIVDYCFYFSCGFIYWSCPATPTKGGRRHQGASPFYIYHLIVCLKWVYLSNLGIETSLKHNVNKFWWDNLPPPQWYGTPPFPQKKPFAYYFQHCSISESRPPICMLFAAFQSHNLPRATYVQHFRAVYFLPNTSALPMYYLHAVYILPTSMYFSTYIRPIACL